MTSDSDTGFDSNLSDENSISEDDSEKKEEVKGCVKRKSKAKDVKSKKKSKLNQELCKPPTVDELNRLRETENLFHSNLFRLQIEEMLKEVKIKEKHKKKFDKWFVAFKEIVMKMKKDKNDPRLITEQEWMKQMNLKLPIPQNPYQIKGSYKFIKPESVEIIGSYMLDTCLAPNISVDVKIVIPESFYKPRDNLNTKYHRKQAMYMCELGAKLKSHPDVVKDVNFTLLDDNIYKPVLEITPQEIDKHFKVYVHFVPQTNSFKLNRINPSKNNIRCNWFFGGDSVNDEDITPTPHYNTTIAWDLVSEVNKKYLFDTFSKHTNLKDGVLLFKVWLKQRQLNIGLGSFNGFLLSMLAAYLINTKKLNSFMSSYQIVRNLWNFISQSDWTTKGVNMCQADELDKNKPTVQEFHDNFDVVMIDVTGYCNLCGYMTSAMFQRLRQESLQAIRYLDNSSLNSFKTLFMTPLPFHQTFDHIINFHDFEATESVVDLHSPAAVKLDYAGHSYPQARNMIYNLIKKALGDRVLQIDIKQHSPNVWKLNKKLKHNKTLVIGVNIDPEVGHSIVTKGPEANLEEADKFREFWGEKSELRRFQDGSITEAVVWDGKCLHDKRLVCKQIVEYILKLKYTLCSFKYVCNQLEYCITRSIQMYGYNYVTGEEATVAVVDKFDKLSKLLRNLEDLPLGIVSVQGSSPVFRYTDPFPAVPSLQKNRPWSSKSGHSLLTADDANCQIPSHVPVMNVVVQLASSNKWPYDINAIQRVKAAFSVKISELLRNKHQLISQVFQDSAEVYFDGYVFKLIIFYPNEIGLHKKIVTPDGSVKYRDTETSLSLEHKLLHLPLLTSTIHGLHQQYPAYGPACCIAKRWTNSQLVDFSHLSEPAIELLVAHVFLRPEPYYPTTQPQVAFIRFLHLLSRTDWNSDPLILNFNEEMNRQDVLDIETHFNTNRGSLPPVFIATPTDRFDSLWTKHTPTPLVLLRLIKLADQALSVISQFIFSTSLEEHIQLLFQTSTAPFDIVIHLNKDANVKSYQKFSNLSKRIKLEQYQKTDDEVLPIVDFDPVQLYLNTLRENYEEFCLFFHDTFGGEQIGVVLKPNCYVKSEFKVSQLNCRQFNKNNDLLEFNVDFILEDFYHIGKGLVESIERKISGNLQTVDLFY